MEFQFVVADEPITCTVYKESEDNCYSFEFLYENELIKIPFTIPKDFNMYWIDALIEVQMLDYIRDVKATKDAAYLDELWEVNCNES